MSRRKREIGIKAERSLRATGFRFDAESLAYYRANPTEFIERHLVNPETDRPFELLPAERAFLEHAFKTDSRGRLVHRTWVYGSIKKSGKSTFGALLMIVVVLLYGGRFAEGYCVANDLEQALSRVFQMACRIAEASPILKAEAEIYQDRIVFPATGAVVKAVPCDYAGQAGGAPCISIFDELWGATSKKAARLWDEFVPVPTRKISCRLVVSHAGFSDEGGVLLDLYNRGLKLPEVGKDLRAGDGLLFFWSHVPIAPWQDEKWLADMRQELRPAQYLRMIENRFTAGEDSFVPMADWDLCVDPTLGPAAPDKKLPIWVALDMGIVKDSTAVVGMTWDGLNKQIRLVNHRIFYPSKGQTVQFLEVEAYLHYLRDRFNLREIRFDPWQMERTFQELLGQRWPIVKYDQTPANLTAMGSNLYDAITGHWLRVYPCDEIRTAVSHAIARESGRGWKITKEKSSHKIDVVVALAMAALAAVESQSSHKLTVIRTPELVAGYNGMPVRTPFGPSRSQRIAPQSAFPVAQTPSPADCGAPGYRGFGSTYAAPAVARRNFMQSQSPADPVSFFPVKAYNE